MNPLPELDNEYPVDLSETICIRCDDTQWIQNAKGTYIPCPVCGHKKKEDHDE